MFLILLPLQLLAVLLLLRKHFLLLLLLVFTIAIPVACVSSGGTLERRHAFRLLFPESPQNVGWPALLAESRWLRLHHDELDNGPVS